MSSPDAIILGLLNQRLSDLASTPRLPIAWQDVPFDAGGQPYLEQAFMPADVRSVDLDKIDDHVGIYQVTVCWTANAGVVAPLTLAGAVAAWFKRGTVLAGSGLRVFINRPPSITESLREPSWVRVPVTVPYRTFVDNTT